MQSNAEPTDEEAVARLTRELPLSRYCVIGGEVRIWVKLDREEGEQWQWLPYAFLIRDNLLHRVAAGALLRAGVQSFRSVEEAAAWGREQVWPD
jgi:hypothetical protein